MVDIGLFLAYILIGACLITAIGMPLVKAFGDPEALKKMGTGVGMLVAVFVVAFLTATGERSGESSETVAKLVGAGLTTFYILAIVAIGGIVYTEIKKSIE